MLLIHIQLLYINKLKSLRSKKKNKTNQKYP